MGQITRSTTGNGVQSLRYHNPATSRLQAIYSWKNQNILQNLGYEYDDFANLAARNDKTKDLREDFTYDELDRLTDISLNGVPTGHMAYDALGRMTGKQADGQVVFSSAQYDYQGPDGQLRPHAISSAQVQSNPFPTERLDIDYTMFDKVKSIRYSAGGATSSFSYGYDHQRIACAAMTVLETKTKFYVGNCEFVSEYAKSDRSLTYLSGPLGVFAVVEKSGGEESIHYVLKDHLGSWTTITDTQGNLVQEQSFDAWGNMRNPNTWTGTVTQQPMFDRGFTGHEHVQYFGLINMNGRMYDPVTSGFLSVDNYVQAPDFSQSFNRYAYCLNNPLKYTDPSGEMHILVAVAIGAAINVTMNGINNVRYGESFFLGAGTAAVVGAVQGLFSYGIGQSADVLAKAVTNTTGSVAWGKAAQTGFQLVAHGTMGGMSTMARGGKFWHGFASSATASVISGSVGLACAELKLSEGWTKAAMIAGGALSGGVSAEMSGGDFIDGLCNGLICAGLNHALHWVAGEGGKLLYKQYLKGIENFKHATQKDALLSSRNNVFGNRQTLCKYACLEMIEKLFFGSNGRGQWELSMKGVNENQKMLPFYQKLGEGMDYSVFSIDNPSQIAESLASGDPIVLTEWDGSGNGHSVVVIGVAAYEGDAYQLLYYDPLAPLGQSSTKYWSEVSDRFSMCRFGKYNQ